MNSDSEEDSLLPKDGPPVTKKRFTFKSYQESLKSVHLPSATKTTLLDDEIEDTDSHFHTSIEHWKQLNLAPSFLKYANRVQRMSASMPLLLLNWEEIVKLWIETVCDCEEDALRPLLDMLQNLTHDLRSTLVPQYPTLLSTTTSLFSRSLTPETLTTLLSTLSSLFRYILSSSPQLLPTSFHAIRLAMIDSRAKVGGGVAGEELQRMIAEVWGSVLRKVKSAHREQAIRLLADGLEGCEEGTAWCLIYAAKAPSHSIHPSTPLLFQPLIDIYLSSDDADRIFILLRRFLTSMIHHTSDAQGFSPLSNAIIERYKAEIQTTSSDSSFQRVLELLWRVLATVCSVRKGSRMDQKQINAVLSLTHSEKVVFYYDKASSIKTILTFMTSVLNASETAAWMGNGRQVVARIWEKDKFVGMRLASTLAHVNWPGWKVVMIPLISRHVFELLNSVTLSSPTLRYLAQFVEQGKLKDTDEAFRSKLMEWVFTRLERCQGSEPSDIVDLESVEKLVRFSQRGSPQLVQAFSILLKNRIDEMADVEASLADFDARPGNSAWVIATCLKAIASLWSFSGKIDPTDTIFGNAEDLCMKMVTIWGWNSSVMKALVEFVGIRFASSLPSSRKAFTDAFATFESCLLSPYQDQRIATLQLLCSPLIERSPAQNELVQRILSAEQLPLDMTGAKERQLKISRVALGVTGQVELKLILTWLIAQLKVNIRPLWGSTAKAIGSLSAENGAARDLTWELVFRELKRSVAANEVDLGVYAPSWTKDGPKEEKEEEREKEKTWRCPSRYNIEKTVEKDIDLVGADQLWSVVMVQIPQSRLDEVNYEAQLLCTLGECPSVAEKHNRSLVPFFLAINSPPLPRSRLKNYLLLFSKFSNPKSVHQTNLLRRLFLQLLSSPDRSMQIQALNCLLTYQSPSLTPYEENLRRMLDEVKWRDEFSSFNFEDVPEGHRQELMDLLSRLLFGMMAEKRGRSGRTPDRKAAALTLLGRARPEELRFLVNLMLEPLRGVEGIDISGEEKGFQYSGIANATQKQIIGYLVLLGDLMKYLGQRTVEHWPALLGATMEILRNVQNELIGQGGVDPQLNSDESIEPVAEEVELEDPDPRSTKGARQARQLGLRRFADFFKVPSSFNFRPYMAAAFSSFISPRLSRFAWENCQAPTALLEVFVVWAQNPETMGFLNSYDSTLLPSVYECLALPGVKEPVISKIFDIVEPHLETGRDEDQATNMTTRIHVNSLIDGLSALVVNSSSGRPSLSEALLQRMTNILSFVAPEVKDESQASRLLNLLSPQLEKHFRIVPDRIKADLLKVVQNIIPRVPALRVRSSELHLKTYQTLSSTFLSIKYRQARINNSMAFQQLAVMDGNIEKVAELLSALNSFSELRPEQPDFGRRLAAFAELNESLYLSLDSHQWLPLLYTMLFFIQDSEELSIRTNAALSLRKFVDSMAHSQSLTIETAFKRVLYPELRKLLRSKVEVVRQEVISVIAHAVEKCPSIAFLREMQPLLMAGDEEANFFNNIHHIQVHRRARALRRLGELCHNGSLNGSNLNDILVPIVGHFVGESDAKNQSVVDEAIKALGLISEQLAWGPYNALFQQYMKLAKEKTGAEKVYIRAIIAILTHFHFTVEMEDDNTQDERQSVTLDSPMQIEAQLKHDPINRVQTSKITDAITARILPSLLEYLENRYKSEESIRIPIAIGVVHIARHLPPSQSKAQISRLLTILSQELRSKSQDTRDLVRDTLSKIVVLLGHEYLGQTVSELRSALTRGPQLHILASTIHSILTQITLSDNIQRFPNLDEACQGIAQVAAEVVFGQSGRDVLSEGFTTSVREVRGSSSRGLDTLGILARHVNSSKVGAVLEPCRAIMHETEALKVMNLVDDVLRRIASGLNGNPLLSTNELLVLCHTLMSQNAQFLNANVPKKRKAAVRSDILVDIKVKRTVETDHYANNSHRFISLGLDLFVTAFKRGRFDVTDAQHIAQLNPFVSLIGNCLYSSNANVVVAALKATAAIVKWPLPSIPKSLPVFIRQTFVIIRQGGTTESDVVQTAFKTLAVVIRDASGSQVKESDLTYLIELVSPDLEEPERQGAVFSLLRAIIARKFVIPEIYDLMDKVSEVMVTGQSSHVQEQCRAVLLQFLLDYPQGKGRLKNQMSFLAKNLSYAFESGRKSVMELLGTVFSKFNPDLLKEYMDLFFMSLVMVLANDDSSRCREMAAELLKSLLERLEDDQRKTTMNHLHAWAIQEKQPQLSRVAVQVFGLSIDTLQDRIKDYCGVILQDLRQTIQRSADELQREELEDEEVTSLDWELPYHSMTTLGKLLKVFPELIGQISNVPWPSIYSLMVFPHAWVRLAASRLQGTLFSASPVSPPSSKAPSEHPMSLQSFVDSVRKLSIQLKSANLDPALGLQIVKNLFYIGKVFVAIPATLEHAGSNVANDDEEEEEDGAMDNPLRWMVSKMSNQARSAYTARRSTSTAPENWSIQPSSILRWLAAMVQHMDKDLVEHFLNHVLIPTYRIIEDDTVKDSQMEELKTLAQELQDLVQSKVGTTIFASAYNSIRQKVLSVRRDRRTARVLQATSNPEIAAKRKIQKNISKRDSRKRKTKVQMHGKETKKMRNY
ncbi:U3 snoRNP protein [Tulasnella sp. 419]|nr:U3 snoRNP protein [Tulasnella sp. 419]